ncbi:hypothetical protein Tco_0021147, partial [Tanacetum coccineum]
MANNLSLPTNFSGDGDGDDADNGVSSPLVNNLEYGLVLANMAVLARLASYRVLFERGCSGWLNY